MQLSTPREAAVPPTPDPDLPGIRELVDVLADGLGESATASVTAVEPGAIRTTVGQTASGRRIRLDPGTRARVTWRNGQEVFGVSAELVAVHPGDDPEWELRLLGAVQQTQRRDAVRTPLQLPVTVNAGREDRTGVTLDLSEGGARLLLKDPPVDAGGVVPHSSGTRLRLTIDLDGTDLADEVRLIRRYLREDGYWEVSVHFTGLTEQQEDAVRRRVFTELRVLRSRGVI
ncbi:flagellar brake protein [Blastococcus sp. URHD0036]|uniref:flagellar brake protein n=1 Tax=Blastococcus sp. URHD0036 TaxID=1380356 RepID=UPI00049593B9|nr:PilZ domain-containing protein [Blastococcus sp. URHD0036]